MTWRETVTFIAGCIVLTIASGRDDVAATCAVGFSLIAFILLGGTRR